MFYTFDYSNYIFEAFWSKEVNRLVQELNNVKAKSHATHHEIGLKFINKQLFNNKGRFDKRRRKMGGIYSDLRIPSSNTKKRDYNIEYKLYSSKLKNLRKVLDQREKIFVYNEYIYFSYFLQRKWRDKTKLLKTHSCIYYLVILILPKKILSLEMKELLNNIRDDAKDFTEKLKHESDIDLEEEELLGVDNIIKVVDLERELEENKEELKKIKEIIKEKDKEIKRLKEQLKKK